MPASPTLTPRTTGEPETAPSPSAAGEVFLSPRVVDERAFTAFSERLLELVNRADRAHASLDGVSGRGAELLSSLEALVHTQSQRAKEIRASLERVEAQVRALDAEKLAARQRTSGVGEATTASLTAITEASAAAVERAEAAKRSVDEAAHAARAELRAIAAARPTGPIVDLAELDARTARANEAAGALAPLVERAEEAAGDVRRITKELAGLGDQAKSLLSAMRSTILECAEARDAADARLERLGSLGNGAEAALESATARLRETEDRAARLTPAALDLDPIVREVAARVMAAVETRLETALTRHAPEPTPAPAAGIDDALAEIRGSIEMLSEVTLRLAALPREALETIPAAVIEKRAPAPVSALAPAMARRSRERRVAALPVGASGELGDPSRLVTLWSWSEGRS